MPQQTMWERLKSGSKTGFDKAFKQVDKLGAPVNRLSNRLGCEAFWPTSLDKESDKCARILKSFCKDGFYKEEEFQPAEGPRQKQKVVQKIPERVIQRAVGLAIFTTMRTGLWMSGAGGSGVLVARMADGTWSPPSGILLHTAGLGFLVGVDIYDCVIVINTREALEAFTKIRCTLGGEISVAAGPVGAGATLETEIHKRRAPVYTYLKSRGFYAGVQFDGTVIIERTDENERFYGHRIPVRDILDGKVRHPPYAIKRLMETIKAAQGDRDVDESMIPTEAPPADYEIDDGRPFGVPGADDPDPYGVLALEKEGMSLKEAGTKKRASWEEFSFHPSPTSPVHSIVARQADHRRSLSMRSSWRSSAWTTEPRSPSSLRTSMDMGRPPTLMSNASTQTAESEETGLALDPRRSWHNHGGSKGSLSNSQVSLHMQEVPENAVLETSSDVKEPTGASRANAYTTPPHTPPPAYTSEEQSERQSEPLQEKSKKHDDNANHGGEVEDEDEDDTQIEEPNVRSVQTVRAMQTAQSVQTMQPTSPIVLTKPRIVNVPKRVPPKLPPRNPNRAGPALAVDAASVKSVDGVSSAAVSVASHETVAEDAQAAKEDRAEADAVEPKIQIVQLRDGSPSAPAAAPAVQTSEDDHAQAEESAKMPGGFD